MVSGEDGLVRLEWAHDSAFRFFPARRDDTYGYRLHEIDAAINKILALAGRQEARDFVDVLYLHDNLLSVGAMTWAACGKDTGYTPDFLLDQAGRHVAYTESDLHRLNLSKPLDIQKMKRKWIRASERAKRLIDSLPPDEIGCLYLDAGGKPVTPDPESVGFQDLTRHRGRVAGAWPNVKGKEG
ncbi:MAG: hypothetical protein ACOCVH_02320 [Verrucomicrobiota bacterium]